MSECKIIDLSGWNENVPYSKLPANDIKGAILRITEKGNKVDSQFRNHFYGCRNAGVPIIGVYKYSYALSVKESQLEAASVINTLNSYKDFDGVVFLDLEDEHQKSLGLVEIRNITEAFRKIIIDNGYKFGIYCNTDWYLHYIPTTSLAYDYWLASYPYDDNGSIVERLRPNKTGQVGWQYTSHYKIDSSIYDMSVFKKEYIDTIIGEKAMADTKNKVQETINSAGNWMINLANDNSHGYSQDNRWGPDYDCSSAIIQSWKQAGVPLTCTYTGNMYDNMIDNGFTDVTSKVDRNTGAGMMFGDVLLNVVHHTAMFIGNGQEVEASINEKGGAHGGQPGDQTGREILVRSYRNYPWDYVLRYTGGKQVPVTSSAPVSNLTKINFTFEQVKKGDKCQSVWILRTMLRGRGYRTEDDKFITRGSVFDDNTDFCVRYFQKKFKLEVDGIVGPKTWKKLLGFD